MGFQAWRADFDDILIRRGVSLGVNVLQPCVAKQPMIRHGRLAGIVTTCGEVPARFVLDATGSASWLSGRLGIPRTIHSRRLMARYGYTRSPQRAVSRLPSLRRTEDGWTWIARIQPDRYHWTTLSLKDVPDGSPAELARAELIGTIHSADVTWFESRSPAGNGYFLLGDAASRLDPGSSHGVLKALMSGIFAAHLISNTQRGLSERSAADAYTRWIGEWFRHDARKLATYYRETGLAIAPLLAKGESPWGSSNLRPSNPKQASK